MDSTKPTDPSEPSTPRISSNTREKAEAAKHFIERRYTTLKSKHSERTIDLLELQRKMTELHFSREEQEMLKQEIFHHEAVLMRLNRRKLTPYDFEPIDIIGKGAFGEVRLVRDKHTDEVLAIKKMNKAEMLYKNQIQHIRAEQDLLSNITNPWIVHLKCSFQDSKYLYLGMEFLPGGDLMTMLMRRYVISEKEAQFYIAELVLAIESVHQMHYIHRDIKPDNVLLDRLGHVKLSDFGLCKHFNLQIVEESIQEEEEKEIEPASEAFHRTRARAFSVVGTPDYIAPEVFTKQGYTESVDWWSLGVILFEMVVGYPPFYSDSPSATCQRILRWEKTLQIPVEAKLSEPTIDLIKRLLCDVENRLIVEEIKEHQFFQGVDWTNIRESLAPNVPVVSVTQLTSEEDTSNFDSYEEVEPFHAPLEVRKRQGRTDPNFIGYTFKRADGARKSRVKSVLEELEELRKAKLRPGSNSTESTDFSST